MNYVKTIEYVLNHNKQKNNNPIRGIQFTNREIEIIVCLINGRSVKKIATLLSISPKTVEVHIRNIMLKMACNSKEKIIDFIESSPEYSKLIKNYKLILEKNHFNSALNKSKSYLDNINELKVVCSNHLAKKNNLFIHALEEVLNFINIKVIKYSLVEIKSHKSEKIIYLATNNKEINDLEIALQNNTYCNFNGLILCLNIMPDLAIKNFHNILINHNSSFYLVIIEILYLISLQKDILKIKETFEKQLIYLYGLTYNASSQKKEATVYNLKTPGEETMHLHNLIENSTKNKLNNKTAIHKKLLIGGSIFFIGCLLYFLVKSSEKSHITQPDLWIPSEKILIKRSKLINNIRTILEHNNNKIKTVVIIGMGGTGKTTIARYYALNQNKNIFWEINGTNENEIVKSFERMALALAKTPEKLEELNQIYKFDNTELFKSNLMVFVQKHLFNQNNWMLIYDNVDNINDLIKYLPLNDNTWGTGKVLILTRNQNIATSKYIDNDNVIYMPQLTDAEKEKLFLKIYNDKDLKLAITNNKIDLFLKRIPSFPLDVTTAAYFLKNTGMNHDEYLKNIDNHELHSRVLDKKVTDDPANIFKTRYIIVANAVNQIINHNNDFKNKLLAISVLKHNNIPLSLLYDNNEKGSLIDFLQELSRYSFIDYKNTINNQNISLHNSVHDIIHLSLKNNLNEPNGIHQMNILAKKLSDKLNELLDQENISELRSLLPQAENLIINVTQVNESIVRLKYQIGRAYRYLGQFKNAIQILETIKNFENNVEVLIELGTTYKNIGKYHKSINLIEHALHLAKDKYGPNSLETALVEIRLDTPYRKLEKYQEAKKLLEHSLKVHESYGDDKLANITWICTKLGYINTKLGYIDEAIKLFKRSLEIQTKLYGKNNIRIAWTFVRLANAYKELKQYDLAKDLFQKSFKIYDDHYGRKSTKTAWVLCALGEIEGLLGDFDNAEKKIQEALAIQKEYYGESTIRIVWGMEKLVDLYKNNNQLAKSEYYAQIIDTINKKGE